VAALTAGLLLALGLGLAGVLWKWREADRRGDAEREASEQAHKRLGQVEKGVEILASVFRDLDPRSEEKEGRTLRVLLGERLGDAVKQLEGEAVGDPAAVARLQTTLGNSLRELGHLKEAEAVLTKARQTLEDALGPDQLDTLSARSHLAAVYWAQGRYARAEAVLVELLKARTARQGADHVDTIRARGQLAAVYRDQGKPQAEGLLKEVAEGFTARLGAGALETLSSKNNLALVYQAQGKYDLAEAIFREAVEARAARQGPDHPDTLLSKNSLAELYHDQKKYDKAEALFKESLAGLVTKLGANHAYALITRDNLGALYHSRAKYAQAETLHSEALQGFTETLGPDHPYTLLSKNNLASVYWATKKLDRSIPLFEEVLRRQTKKLGPDHPDSLRSLVNLGVNYRDAGRLDESIRCLEGALATLRSRGGAPLAGYAWVPGALAGIYDQAKRFARSEPYYRDSLEQARRQFGADDPRATSAMALLGLNLVQQKKFAEGEKALRDCLAVRSKKQPDEWTTFNTQSVLGAALLGQKKHAEAEPLLARGYEGMKQREASIPTPYRQARLKEALERLVQLHDATGNKAAAARRRKELEALNARGNQRAKK
jgi:hypothetical protein